MATKLTYTTVERLERALSSRLALFGRKAPLGAPTETTKDVLQEGLDAEAMVNLWLGQLYKTPLSPRSETTYRVIAQIVEAFAVSELLKNNYTFSQAEATKVFSGKTEALDMLKKISEGRIRLPCEEAVKDRAPVYQAGRILEDCCETHCDMGF